MSTRPRLLFLVPLLAALPGLLAGCDGSSPTEPAASPTPSPSPFAGAWQGTTEQGKSLSFTVGGSAEAPVLTSFDIAVRLDELTPGTGGLICLDAEVRVGASPLSIPIVDNRFLVNVPADIAGALTPDGTTFRFEGLLETAASASGLLMAETPPAAGVCAGRGLTTWTAQKM